MRTAIDARDWLLRQLPDRRECEAEEHQCVSMQCTIEDHVAFKYFVGRRDGTRLPQPLQVSIHFAEIQGFGRLFLGEHSQPVPTAPVAIEYQYQYI